MADQRIRELNQVAEQGNINLFYDFIKNNVKLLEHIDELQNVIYLLKENTTFF